MTALPSPRPTRHELARSIAERIDWTPTVLAGGEHVAIVEQVLRLAEHETRAEVRALRAELNAQSSELAVRRLQDLVAARTPQPAEPCARCRHRIAPGCPDCAPQPAVPDGSALACPECGRPAITDEPGRYFPDPHAACTSEEVCGWVGTRSELAQPAVPDGEAGLAEVVGYRWAVRDVYPDGTPYIEHPPPDALARDDGEEWARDVVGHRGGAARLYRSPVGRWAIVDESMHGVAPAEAAAPPAWWRVPGWPSAHHLDDLGLPGLLITVCGKLVRDVVPYAAAAEDQRCQRCPTHRPSEYQPAYQPTEPSAPSFCACTSECSGEDMSCPMVRERAKGEGGEDVPARLRALADTWDRQQAAYPDTAHGRAAAAAVRLCAREVRAAVAAALARSVAGRRRPPPPAAALAVHAARFNRRAGIRRPARPYRPSDAEVAAADGPAAQVVLKLAQVAYDVMTPIQEAGTAHVARLAEHQRLRGGAPPWVT